MKNCEVLPELLVPHIALRSHALVFQLAGPQISEYPRILLALVLWNLSPIVQRLQLLQLRVHPGSRRHRLVPLRRVLRLQLDAVIGLAWPVHPISTASVPRRNAAATQYRWLQDTNNHTHTATTLKVRIAQDIACCPQLAANSHNLSILNQSAGKNRIILGFRNFEPGETLHLGAAVKSNVSINVVNLKYWHMRRCAPLGAQAAACPAARRGRGAGHIRHTRTAFCAYPLLWAAQPGTGRRFSGYTSLRVRATTACTVWWQGWVQNIALVSGARAEGE
ncbi:hypothetical protein B0H14DRAFT_2579449 [Mycena olivaceomarginata]|nr:hypothetical protein B0H14DRAFT_2579449 [Mycena olivaceomarginata]